MLCAILCEAEGNGKKTKKNETKKNKVKQSDGDRLGNNNAIITKTS